MLQVHRSEGLDGNAWQDLPNLDVDDEGRPMPDVGPIPDERRFVHHIAILVRYGPYPLVYRKLHRENLTPFGAEGHHVPTRMGMPASPISSPFDNRLTSRTTAGDRCPTFPNEMVMTQRRYTAERAHPLAKEC